MTVQVHLVDGEHRVSGDWDGADAANMFLAHLQARAFSPATIRAYAFDVVNLARFLAGQGISLSEVTPVDVFAWVDWQGARRDGPAGSGKVVALRQRSAAASTVNRQVAAVRAFFEYLVMTGTITGNPVPCPRRGQGLRPAARGLLGHLGPGRSRGGGRLVRQPRRLPESLPAGEVDAFVSSLRTHRDRAMALAMLLGGLRSAEVRGLKLADADMGRRRLRVIGKGGKERHVPVDPAFFAELAAYLRLERPPGLATPECFVVLRGPTAGAAVTEAGLRSLFRRHREAYLRDRARRGGHRPAGAAGADGALIAGNHGVSAGPGLLNEYLGHLQTLGLGDRAVRHRVRIARDFTGRYPDLQAWMTLPAAHRVRELTRTGAWPLVCHAIGTGRLRLDLELAGAKNLAGLARAVEARDPGAFAAARAAALRLGWKTPWTETVLGECLAVLLAWHGGHAGDLTSEIVDAFDTRLAACMTTPPSSRRAYRNRLAGVRHLLFETRVIDAPPRRRPWARTLEQRFADVAMTPEIRRVLLRYVQTRAAVLRPRSVESLVNDLLPFAEYLTASHPGITSLRQLRRDHVEGYLTWNRTRPWRGQRAAAGNGRVISAAVAQSTILSLRNMLDDIAAWGWSDTPPRRLVFAADVPKLGQPLPRALPPDVDQALMNAVAGLDDDFARIGLTVLRGAGLRVGELLDLEIGSVISYGPAGTWLRVPLGKLATERMVPLEAAALTALDEWAERRGAHRPVPHPRTGALTDFLFTARGRRLGATRLRNGLLAAAQSAGLRGPGGEVLVVTRHQLRHTWATGLANAGMSLQALMALLGHVTPQMTIRYATLASPVLRSAYDEAMGKMRRQFTLTPAGKPIIPDKVSWLNSEMLKTRVAHGYCSRHETAGACPYANICETCDNFVTGREFRGAIRDQIADVRHLQADAEARGWDSEAARHDRVASALTSHLALLDR